MISTDPLICIHMWKRRPRENIWTHIMCVEMFSRGRRFHDGFDSGVLDGIFDDGVGAADVRRFLFKQENLIRLETSKIITGPTKENKL